VYAYPLPKTLQTRDVPDDVHTTLRARAAAAGTSLSDYVLRELIVVADRPEVSDVLQRARERSGGALGDDILHAIRSERDRDHSR